MTTITKTSDDEAYYVAYNDRYSYVRGIDAAQQRLADYLNTTVEDVRKHKHNIAGLILQVSHAEAAAAGIDMDDREETTSILNQVNELIDLIVAASLINVTIKHTTLNKDQEKKLEELKHRAAQVLMDLLTPF